MPRKLDREREANMADDFNDYFRLWLGSACSEWNLPKPNGDYYNSAFDRIPVGLRKILTRGISDGLILTEGLRFRPKDIAPHKGPYQWFSNRDWHGGPHPNWEYFVHAAEYVRLHRVASSFGLTLLFEDNAMDLAFYDGDVLLVCVEVKFEASQLPELIRKIKSYELSVDLESPDRGNDPLRKAKYIVRGRPKYFTAVAIGARLEYHVDYPDGQAFRLIEDVIPWA